MDSIDDVIAAIDIEGVPRDQFGAIHPEERDGNTYVLDRHQAATWRL